MLSDTIEIIFMIQLKEPEIKKKFCHKVKSLINLHPELSISKVNMWATLCLSWVGLLSNSTQASLGSAESKLYFGQSMFYFGLSKLYLG